MLLAELCWSVLGSMATRRLLTDRDITGLILDSASDAHSSGDEDIAPQSDSDDVTVANCT